MDFLLNLYSVLQWWPFQRFLSNILLLNVEENIETVQRDLREVHEMVNSSMGATN